MITALFDQEPSKIIWPFFDRHNYTLYMKQTFSSAAPVTFSKACGSSRGMATGVGGFRPIASKTRFQRGFALVVTLTLMILLTILALGMLSLSAVSIRTASRDSDQQTARANARMAMMIAIGELQRTVGPDQRVTAPADLKNPTAAMPQWVGVYGNSARASYDDAPDAVSYPPPTLLSWLVSGNESSSFQCSKMAGDFGKVTSPPAAIPFAPTDAVSNIAGANASSANLTINGTKAALLVGSNSAGPYDPARNQFVAAPIVATKDASKKTSGGYAYWVSDEGTKARINLQDNYRTATSNVDHAKSYSFVSQRSGIEAMRRDFSNTGNIGPDYDPASDRIQNLVTTGQFPLLNKATLSDPAKARFHDLTAYSSSVLADCYAGGLKQNFSAALQGNSPSGSEMIFKPARAKDFGLPTWGLLRSWAAIKAPRSSPAAPPAITPRPYDPVTKTAGFGPVISTSVLGFGLERGDQPDSLRVQLYPAVILWNPHAAPIAAATYELGMTERNGGTITVNLIKGDNTGRSIVGNFSMSRGDRPTFVDDGTAAIDATSGNGFFRFRVQGSEIPPGESHIYVLDPSLHQTPYNPNGSSTLVRANESLPLGITRYLTGPSLTYPAANYPDVGNSRSRMFLTTTNTGSSVGPSDGKPNNLVGLAGDQFQAILTSPGKLSNGFSATTPVYQAVLENCASPYLHGPNSVQDFRTYISDYVNGVGGLAPIFAIRSKMVMEGRNHNSHPPFTGAMGMQGANRWLATSNPLAPYTKRTKAEYAYNGGNMVQGGALINYWDASFPHFLGMSPNHPSKSYRSGIGWDQSGTSGWNPFIMSDVLPDDLPLLSLGQLQHAPLSVYGFSPTYAFGNSKADLRFKDRREKTYLKNFVAPPGADSPNSYTDSLYDMPWHLNRALWDRYFVSSVPDDLTQSDIDQGKPLPNARMTYINRDGEAPKVGDLKSSSPDAMINAAAQLMVAGGFNINSTSVDAWRAILTGTNKVAPAKEFANPTFQSADGLNAMIPRFARSLRLDDSSDPIGVLNMYNSQTKDLGNRELVLLGGKGTETPAAAAARLAGVAGELSSKIVEEIRARGPFLSLSDFINRDLVAGDRGLRGALQAAIDRCEAPNEVNPAFYPATDGGPLKSDYLKIPEYDVEGYLGGPESDLGSATSIAYRNRFDQTAKVMTQADLLTTLGPVLSARSDTFVIRCYGEAVNPAGVRTSKAWCEAVIQRTPDYVDSADKATVPPGKLTREVNKTFGRSMEIIAFRWLSADEI